MKVNLNVIPLFKGKTTKNEKIEFLRKRYAEEMKQEDKKEKSVNIPYFLRVENKINNVKQSGMIDTEYNKYKILGV
jgi:hypothetical protein